MEAIQIRNNHPQHQLRQLCPLPHGLELHPQTTTLSPTHMLPFIHIQKTVHVFGTLLRSTAGKIPLLYGLPRVHKPGIPLRPIVSFVNSPTYQLSKHLVSILSPLVGKSASHVRNSSEFATFIAGQSLPNGTVLVSFDVVSLFTNVPVDLAVKVAHERLSLDTSLVERTALSAEQVVNLLRFCLDATFLAYRGEFYQQTFGTAMGSPVSVTVTNLVMEDVEERALSTYSSPPPFGKGMWMTR